MKHLRLAALPVVAAAALLAACAPPPTPVQWTDTPRGLGQTEDGTRFTISCAAAGEARPLWGTGTYTDDSSICTAAAYEGLITVEAGGTVTYEIAPGQESYTGGTQNGINSGNWGSWDGSFFFVTTPV